jgi:hypothetical protein
MVMHQPDGYIAYPGHHDGFHSLSRKEALMKHLWRSAIVAATVVGGSVTAAAVPAYAATPTTLTCASVTTASAANVALLLGLLGLQVSPNDTVGLTCSPGNDPAAGTVVCGVSDFNGLIVINPRLGAC